MASSRITVRRICSPSSQHAHANVVPVGIWLRKVRPFAHLGDVFPDCPSQSQEACIAGTLSGRVLPPTSSRHDSMLNDRQLVCHTVALPMRSAAVGLRHPGTRVRMRGSGRSANISKSFQLPKFLCDTLKRCRYIWNKSNVGSHGFSLRCRIAQRRQLDKRAVPH